MVTMPHYLISFSFFLVSMFVFFFKIMATLSNWIFVHFQDAFRNKLSASSVFLWVYTGRHVAECTQRSSTSTSTSLLLCTIYINYNLLIRTIILLTENIYIIHDKTKEQWKRSSPRRYHIPQCDSLVLLGLTFQHNCKFSEHVRPTLGP